VELPASRRKVFETEASVGRRVRVEELRVARHLHAGERPPRRVEHAPGQRAARLEPHGAKHDVAAVGNDDGLEAARREALRLHRNCTLPARRA